MVSCPVTKNNFELRTQIGGIVRSVLLEKMFVGHLGNKLSCPLGKMPIKSLVKRPVFYEIQLWKQVLTRTCYSSPGLTLQGIVGTFPVCGKQGYCVCGQDNTITFLEKGEYSFVYTSEASSCTVYSLHRYQLKAQRCFFNNTQLRNVFGANFHS